MAADIVEFARRLCARAHPIYSTGMQVPCGEHTRQAHWLWPLTGKSGDGALEIVLQLRAENGVPTPGSLTSTPETPVRAG